MQFILDEVAGKRDEGIEPTCIKVTSDENAVLIFDDGSEIDLTGEVEWGSWADPAKRSAMAKLVVFCGWCDDTAKAYKHLEGVWPGYVGELWPAPPLIG